MKALSQTGAEDIQQRVGGRQWVETLDVFCGTDVPQEFRTLMQWCETGVLPGWHILVSNADCLCLGQESATEDWRRKLYAPVPYQRDDVAENNGANGGVVTSVKLGDTAGFIAGAMDNLDGLVGRPVFLSFHYAIGFPTPSTNELSISYPEVSYEFIVKETSHDKTYVTVSLATALPLERQWPPRKTSKAKCRWVFKGCECQYDGNEASCDHTIAACRALSNIVHFGAFPGCGVGGLAQ